MEKQVRYTVREVFAASCPQEREKTLDGLMREYLDFLKKEICVGEETALQEQSMLPPEGERNGEA